MVILDDPDSMQLPIDIIHSILSGVDIANLDPLATATVSNSLALSSANLLKAVESSMSLDQMDDRTSDDDEGVAGVSLKVLS